MTLCCRPGTDRTPRWCTCTRPAWQSHSWCAYTWTGRCLRWWTDRFCGRLPTCRCSTQFASGFWCNRCDLVSEKHKKSQIQGSIQSHKLTSLGITVGRAKGQSDQKQSGCPIFHDFYVCLNRLGMYWKLKVLRSASTSRVFIFGRAVHPWSADQSMVWTKGKRHLDLVKCLSSPTCQLSQPPTCNSLVTNKCIRINN